MNDHESAGAPRPTDAELEQVVEELAREAHVELGALRANERQFLKEHALKKPMGVLQIWALGVGVVITGEFFGWNPGLKEGGPLGMLGASLFVCVLYMAWVLALAELSVAMPFAGGPLAYGRRAVGPWLGFLMGWSMFLESLFATIGTALATGGYIYFVLQLLDDTLPAALTTTLAAFLTVIVFAVVQWSGAQQQAKLMEWMTYGAIVALIWFWIACIPGVKLDRILTEPLLTYGWSGMFKAIPFAIWWLVMIETVALAPEEAHEPHRTIPRGLALAQVTLIFLVVMTWFFVAAAGADFHKTGDENNLFPLPAVYQEVWPESGHRPHLLAFSVLAICGMVASYNGMLYAVSRQSFSLGRAGYLPRALGHVHPVRRTPDVSIAVWSLVIAAFVFYGYFKPDAVMDAVLTCNLTALIWYVLAMVCLFILRIREPAMERPYKTPLYPFLPAAVIVMSLIAAGVYSWLSKHVVLWLTLGLYAGGLTYYFCIARARLEGAAPEELAARS